VPGKQRSDGFVARKPVPIAMQPRDELRREKALAKIKTLGHEEPTEEMQRGGQRHGLEAKAVGGTKLERKPRQHPIGIDADKPHESEGLGIGTDEDVLAVVERDAVELDATRPPAEEARGLDHRDLGAAFGKRHRGGKAGPTGADHRDSPRGPRAAALPPIHGSGSNADARTVTAGRGAYAFAQVFHAIHSLRSGVRETLRSSTWKPSSRISASSAR